MTIVLANFDAFLRSDLPPVATSPCPNITSSAALPPKQDSISTSKSFLVVCCNLSSFGKLNVTPSALPLGTIETL